MKGNWSQYLTQQLEKFHQIAKSFSIWFCPLLSFSSLDRLLLIFSLKPLAGCLAISSASHHQLLLVKLAFIIKQILTRSAGSNLSASGLINNYRSLNPNSIYLKVSLETGVQWSVLPSVCVCLRKVLIIPVSYTDTQTELRVGKCVTKLQLVDPW